MRVLLQVTMPHEPFNTYVRDGSVGEKIGRILAEEKPEAVYFTAFDGRRTGFIVVDITEPSQIPSLCEPWFLLFNADVQFRPAMTPDDLQRSGLDTLGEKWAETARV